MYDHSLRVPFLVSGPNIQANSRHNLPIYLQDAMATSLELAGVPKPETCEFECLAKVAQGQRLPTKRTSFTARIFNCNVALSKTVVKLIVYPKAKVARLYNLTDDPDELLGLAGEESRLAKKKELFAELLRLQASLDDTMDLKSSFSDLAESR